MTRLALACSLLVSLVLQLGLTSTPAVANDYLSSSRSDWFRYSDGDREVTARIELSEGDGWRLWSDFAGLGSRWVYTEPSSDWAWLWNPDTGYGEPLGDLDGTLGDRVATEIDDANTATFVIARRNTRITTPAGVFRGVTRIDRVGTAGDGGVRQVWFAKGVGVIRYAVRLSGRTRTFNLVAARVGGASFPSANATPSPTTSTPRRAAAPPEWEEVEAILWGCNDTYMVVDTYADAFRALDGRRPRVLSDVNVDSEVVASQLRYEMTSRGVPLDDVEIFVVAVDSVWLRDYGPMILRDANGQRAVGDAEYYWDRPNDDEFPRIYASFRGWPRVAVGIGYEGGNFMSDERGTGFSSNGVLWENEARLGRAGVEREIRKLGVERVEFFEPLVDEATTHIDMFNKVVAPGRAVVSSYPTGHRQKRVVDAAAAKMRALGYTVSRIRAEFEHDEYATYANSVLANGVALVPQYGHASRDRNALEVYRRLGFEARGVDCELLIQYGGAIHCISMQVPR